MFDPEIQTNFILKHQDHDVARIQLSPENGQLLHAQIIEQERMPYGGFATAGSLANWWMNRAIPRNRSGLQDILDQSGCDTAALLLAKNLGLSLTDSYWICPEGADLSWAQVNLYDNVDRRIFFTDQYGTGFTNEPSSALGGQLEKQWLHTQENGWELLKKCSRHMGLQAVNEVFATMLHRLQNRFRYVSYHIVSRSGEAGLYCSCPAFTSKNIELLTCSEVMSSAKRPNHLSAMQHYLQQSRKLGMDSVQLKRQLDYQIITDFIELNVDRHGNNLGLLRDPETLEIMGIAPIFDSGNSMQFDFSGISDKNDMLRMDSNSFVSTFEKLLDLVDDFNAVDLTCLPSAQDIRDLYSQYRIPESKIREITAGYAMRIDIIRQRQQGRSL